MIQHNLLNTFTIGLFALTLGAMVPGKAEAGSPKGAYAYSQSTMILLNHATTHLDKGRDRVAKNLIKASKRRLEIAKRLLKGEHGHVVANEALDVAIEKLSATNILTPREQLAWGIDCTVVAMVALSDSFKHDKSIGRILIVRAEMIMKNGYFDSAAQLLEKASDRFADDGFQASADSLQVAVLKITDPGLSKNEKLKWAKDCIKEAKRQLHRRSR